MGTCTRSQPVGHVTLVFTDIEGSTRLLRELGEEVYRRALHNHRRCIREAFGRYGGYEVDTQGDSFFYAFASASEAVRAVGDATAALEGGPIAIRVGVHTGEPGLDGRNYVGLDVHAAARIMSAGHGGQVLLSGATRALVEAEVRELGEHRLKDFPEPIALFQLGGGPFPPLRTITNTNLPRPVSSFVGRESEVAEVVSLIRDQGARLVTLLGPGGTGKTRLAIEAASEVVGDFAAGVFWVGLAPVRDSALVMETIARTLGAKVGLAEHVGERELLLLLDNLEQVVESAPELGALLRACPKLQLLVTSRELLRVDGEFAFAVPSLAKEEGVALFCARAGVRPSETVTELCRRLDYLPLAIELAAARSNVLSPDQILGRVSQRLDLFQGGRDTDARQQTLRATITWSYELLAPDEQRMFARLSIFDGGFTFEAGVEVADATIDGLESLIHKSLLRYTDERFWMLETIREFALEGLEASGESAKIRRRHAQWFAAIDERMAVDGRYGKVDVLALDRDLDNHRAALRECATHDPESLVRLVWNLARGLWGARGYIREGAAWCEEAVRQSADLPALFQARASQCAAWFAQVQGELELAEKLYRAALEARRGDSPEDEIERAWIVRWLSIVAAKRSDPEEAGTLSEHALEMFRALDDAHAVFVTSHDQAIFALQRGDFRRARVLLNESVARARELDQDDDLASVLLDLGVLNLRERRFAEAAPLFAESLQSALERGLRVHAAMALRGIAATTAAAGELAAAARMLGRAERTTEETDWVMEPYERDAYAEVLGRVLDRADEPELAAALAAGRAMSEADAAAYALATVADRPAA